MGIQFDINEILVKADESAELALLTGIDESIEKTETGWDNYDYPRLLVALRVAGASGYAGLELPIPGFEHPVSMMDSLAALLKVSPGPLDNLAFKDNSYYGWIVVSEGWTVPQPADDAPSDERIAWDLAAQANAFHAHPNRVEQRLILLATRYDQIIYFRKDRGGQPETATVCPDSEQQVMGSVVESLRRLVEVTRRWLPEEDPATVGN